MPRPLALICIIYGKNQTQPLQESLTARCFIFMAIVSVVVVVSLVVVLVVVLVVAAAVGVVSHAQVFL